MTSAEEEELWRAAQQEMRLEEDDYDEELLRGAPCANDAVPATSMQDGLFAHHPPETPHPPIAQAAAAPRQTESTENCGVCAFPPLGRTCFMMRGDNGSVRWLTATALDSTRKKSRDCVADMYPVFSDDLTMADLFSTSVKGRVGDAEAEEDEDEDEPFHVSRELRRLRGTEDGLGLIDVPALLRQQYEAVAAAAIPTSSTGERIALFASAPGIVNAGNEKRTDSTLVEDALWVTKYSPRRFHELLSDDTINLRLLQWMKEWDPYVFGEHTEANASGKVERPEERLAVLVGPPGVGKTTLAHVLATHCGYEPIEINASVDRTTARLEAAIQLAVAPSRVKRRARAKRGEESVATGAKGALSLVEALLQPKCLIIDEMDGIAANVANFLLKQDIHCPVFCLCNDFYVPSLRPLRRGCQHVYHFPPIRPQRLMSRLEEITQREGLTVNQPTLAELVQSSNGDVRCCLHTLQFLFCHVAASSRGASNGSPKSAAQLMREMQGKDSKLGLWDAWRAVFQRTERAKYIQLLRKEHIIDYEATVWRSHGSLGTMHNNTSTQNNSKNQTTSRPHGTTGQGSVGDASCSKQGCVARGFRVDPGYIYVSRAIQQCDDASTLLDGLQEYYTQRPYADYTFQRTRDTAEAFAFQDRLFAAAYRSSGASAALIPFAESYAHTTASVCFVQCASSSRSGPLGFPRESADHTRRVAESSHIAHLFRDGCRGEVASHLCSDTVVACETAPLLLRCLCDASVRLPAHPITSITALGKQEQQLLTSATARYAEYGFTYTRTVERGEEVAEERWELTPPLHRIGCITHHSPNSTRQKTLAASTSLTHAPSIMALAMKEELKQIMVGEIQRHVLQRNSPITKKSHITKKEEEKEKENGISIVTHVNRKRERESDAVTAPPPKTVSVVKKEESNVVPGPKPPTSDSTKPKEIVRRDFFGRPIAASAKGVNSAMGSKNNTSALKSKVTVQYTYHDGSTNAVKIPASFDDF